ncbi:pantoate--beta-alanine ligase [bacterium]|nr:MAG: pantoate--beta-alanine ligase [bacterium]
MGAFHEGHLSLMRTAKAENDLCVASLFVNPTQFGPNEDLSRYPRDLEGDMGLAEAAGVDVLYAPTPETIYPRQTTSVHVAGVSERWEGSRRPGHFDGVATVVLKLFNMVQPAVAYFGQKDLQQCLVLRRMVEDLNVPVELRFLPTNREGDGLAMSSRNRFLEPEDRARASAFPAAVLAAAEAIQMGRPVVGALHDAEKSLFRHGLEIDYLVYVDINDMTPLDAYAPASAVVGVVKVNGVRLLDNRVLDPGFLHSSAGL